jgi:hypothetical protein
VLLDPAPFVSALYKQLKAEPTAFIITQNNWLATELPAILNEKQKETFIRH